VGWAFQKAGRKRLWAPLAGVAWIAVIGCQTSARSPASGFDAAAASALPVQAPPSPAAAPPAAPVLSTVSQGAGAGATPGEPTLDAGARDVRRDAAADLEAAVPASVETPSPFGRNQIVYQAASYAAVETSRWAGSVPFAWLRERGDFGLGASEGFTGEIVGDGDFHVVERDGVPRVPDDAEQVVYAAVTRFEADAMRELDQPQSCEELQSTLLAEFPSQQGAYAIRVRGRFSDAQTRSFQGWSAPYPSAAVLGTGQVTFELGATDGAIVGLYLPAGAAQFCSEPPCVQEGFHFHFLTADRSAGGHLLRCSVEAATVEIDFLRELQIRKPDGSFDSLDLGDAL
jgi:acetolactate decarboxylase